MPSLSLATQDLALKTELFISTPKRAGGGETNRDDAPVGEAELRGNVFPSAAGERGSTEGEDDSRQLLGIIVWPLILQTLCLPFVKGSLS